MTMGPFKKYVTQFLAIFDPRSVGESQVNINRHKDMLLFFFLEIGVKSVEAVV